jgi:hypothetical protein
MSAWTDGSIINKDVLNSLTKEQLDKLAEMLKDV